MTEALMRVPALENTGIKKMIHDRKVSPPMAISFWVPHLN